MKNEKGKKEPGSDTRKKESRQASPVLRYSPRGQVSWRRMSLHARGKSLEDSEGAHFIDCKMHSRAK